MVAFTAGAVLTAANLNTAFNALTFRAVTGTSDTLVLADNGGAVSYSNASAITATVPPFSAVAYANGTVIQLLNLGAGVVTITAGVGVTLNGSVVTLAQNAGGTLIKTATNTWYFLPSVSGGSGMDLITPTSVVGATLSGGQVSYSAATEVDVNGCFTSAYDNYAIVYADTTSATALQTFRLRLAGTNAITSYRYGVGVVTTTAVSFSAGSNSATSGLFHEGSASVRTGGMNIITGPAIAAVTNMTMHYGAVNYLGTGFTTHETATAYDGFAIIPASGTITGTLRVYGLRNS